MRQVAAPGRTGIERCISLQSLIAKSMQTKLTISYYQVESRFRSFRIEVRSALELIECFKQIARIPLGQRQITCAEIVEYRRVATHLRREVGGSLDVFLPIAGGKIKQALQPLSRLGFWIAQEEELRLAEIGWRMQNTGCGKISGPVQTAASGTLTVIRLFNQVAYFVFRVWIASKQIEANRT